MTKVSIGREGAVYTIVLNPFSPEDVNAMPDGTARIICLRSELVAIHSAIVDALWNQSGNAHEKVPTASAGTDKTSDGEPIAAATSAGSVTTNTSPARGSEETGTIPRTEIVCSDGPLGPEDLQSIEDYKAFRRARHEAEQRTADASPYPDVILVGASGLRDLGITRRTPHAPLFPEGTTVMGKAIRYVRADLPRPSDASLSSAPNEQWTAGATQERERVLRLVGASPADETAKEWLRKAIANDEDTGSDVPREDNPLPCVECIALKAEIARRDKNRAEADVRRAENRRERKVRREKAKGEKIAQWKELEGQRDEARRERDAAYEALHEANRMCGNTRVIGDAPLPCPLCKRFVVSTDGEHFHCDECDYGFSKGAVDRIAQRTSEENHCRVTSDGLIDVPHLARSLRLTEEQTAKITGALDTAMHLGREQRSSEATFSAEDMQAARDQALRDCIEAIERGGVGPSGLLLTPRERVEALLRPHAWQLPRLDNELIDSEIEATSGEPRGGSSKVEQKVTPCGVVDSVGLKLACVAPYGHRGMHQYNCEQVVAACRPTAPRTGEARRGHCPPENQCLACDRLGYHIEPETNPRSSEACMHPFGDLNVFRLRQSEMQAEWCPHCGAVRINNEWRAPKTPRLDKALSHEALLRLLTRLEWSATDDVSGMPWCPICNFFDSADGNHRAYCDLGNALRALRRPETAVNEEKKT